MSAIEPAPVDLTEDEARAFVKHVRASVDEIGAWIVRAVKGRAWLALGYLSWDAMCEAEFDGAVVRLPREDRREAVASLRDAGLSTRAIGQALGVSNSTVAADLDCSESNSRPDQVTSLDGRTRPAAQPARRLAVVQEPGGLRDHPEAARRGAPVAATTWNPAEVKLRDTVLAGGTVVASLRHHHALLSWAEAEDRLVRVDRRSDWGNPFVMGDDGDRSAVIEAFQDHYLPYKPSLLARVPGLRGKVLACWCAPEPCHGDVLAEMANEL